MEVARECRREGVVKLSRVGLHTAKDRGGSALSRPRRAAPRRAVATLALHAPPYDSKWMPASRPAQEAASRSQDGIAPPQTINLAGIRAVLGCFPPRHD